MDCDKAVTSSSAHIQKWKNAATALFAADRGPLRNFDQWTDRPYSKLRTQSLEMMKAMAARANIKERSNQFPSADEIQARDFLLAWNRNKQAVADGRQQQRERRANMNNVELNAGLQPAAPVVDRTNTVTPTDNGRPPVANMPPERAIPRQQETDGERTRRMLQGDTSVTATASTRTFTQIIIPDQGGGLPIRPDATRPAAPVVPAAAATGTRRRRDANDANSPETQRRRTTSLVHQQRPAARHQDQINRIDEGRTHARDAMLRLNNTVSSLGSGREIVNQAQALNSLASSAQVLISLNITDQASLHTILGTQLNLIRNAQDDALHARRNNNRNGNATGNGNRNNGNAATGNGNGNGNATGI